MAHKVNTPFDDIDLQDEPAPATVIAGKSRKSKKRGDAVVARDAVELSSPSARIPSPSAVGEFSSISVMPSPPSTNSAAAAPSYALPARPSILHAGDSNAAGGGHLNELATPQSQSALAASEPIAFERNIIFNDAASRVDSPQHQEFVSNEVITSKYTAYSFLPLNLFEQFMEPANAYFLFVGILQAIPAISTTQGIPTHYVPLFFILAVSALRSAYEDYSRHQSDEAEGRKKYLVYDGHRQGFVTRSSADIIVGDVVKMMFGRQDMTEGQDPSVTYSSSFPADMLMLSSSHSKMHCFVETASLDGETNLKIKNAIPALQNLLWIDGKGAEKDIGADQSSRLKLLDISLDVEAPNSRFDSFKGLLHLNPNGTVREVPQQKIALKSENFLLRGTELRNTQFIYGLVVYSGVDTKIRRNVKTTNIGSKRTAIMQRVNVLLVYMLCVQLLLCFIIALLCLTWTREYNDLAWYLRFTEDPSLAALRSFFTYFIILAQMVPISLLVSNEVVKAAQAKFIAWDLTMYDRTIDQPTIVRNSQLQEDLGQIESVDNTPEEGFVFVVAANSYLARCIICIDTSSATKQALLLRTAWNSVLAS